jgi:hypothetical protein
VADSAEVAPLINQPVVMTGGKLSTSKGWEKASEAWYLDSSRWSVFETGSGPKSWARVPANAADPPKKPLPPVQVSNIKEGTSTISFDVDQTGVPVLVKTSYFPNWQVSGASGVYRATPNLMVVVPTSHHVTLSYGYTTLDWFGFVLTLLGIGGVIALWRLGPVVYPAAISRRRGLHSAGPALSEEPDRPDGAAPFAGPGPERPGGPAAWSGVTGTERPDGAAPFAGWASLLLSSGGSHSPSGQSGSAGAGSDPPGGPGDETEHQLGEPYQRLGEMLAGSYPESLDGAGDGMASWLGLPDTHPASDDTPPEIRPEEPPPPPPDLPPPPEETPPDGNPVISSD